MSKDQLASYLTCHFECQIPLAAVTKVGVSTLQMTSLLLRELKTEDKIYVN